jgi:hypothetical protein
LLELRVGRSEEVPGVGVVRIDFGDAAEGFDGSAGIAGVFVIETEVVPGMGVFGILFDGFFQQRLGFFEALQIEQRHSAIDGGHFQRGIIGGRFFERLQCFFEELLVHVGDADGIEAGRFLGILGGTVCGE